MFTLQIAILATGVFDHWIHGYLWFSPDLHFCTLCVISFHMFPEEVVIFQVVLTLLAFPVLDIEMFIKIPIEHEPS